MINMAATVFYSLADKSRYEEAKKAGAMDSDRPGKGPYEVAVPKEMEHEFENMMYSRK